MIKNEREYRITRAQAARFADAIARLSEETTGAQRTTALRRLQLDALRSQLEDLEGQIQEYESLRSGLRRMTTLTSFDEIPRVLVQARIAAGLTQKQLADQLGLKEQQVQRYEATDYASASFDRVKQVLDALGVQVSDDVILPGPHLSMTHLMTRLREMGVTARFAASRLIPRRVMAQLMSATGGESAQRKLVAQAAQAAARALGISASDILGPTPPRLTLAAAGAVHFKRTARTDEEQLKVYTVYARSVARIALAATREPSIAQFPETVGEMREAIRARYGDLSFDSCLRYAWDLGIPVIPLDDSGVFYGACWRIGGHNVIILKQRTHFVAYWLFVLLHELWHASQDTDQPDRAVIDSGELPEIWGPSEPDGKSDPEEVDANRFADQILFGDQADNLAQAVVAAADRKTENLKIAVRKVAARHGIPVDCLAGYIAHRLSLEGTNWWGAAANLQTSRPDPLETCRKVLAERLDFATLCEADREFLMQALAPQEET